MHHEVKASLPSVTATGSVREGNVFAPLTAEHLRAAFGGSGPDVEGRLLSIAAHTVRGSLAGSGLTPEQQVGVALVAAVLLVRDFPNVRAARGNVINGLTAEFRKKLQLLLPL